MFPKENEELKIENATEHLESLRNSGFIKKIAQNIFC
jgi:hypothetical protein